MRKLATIRIIRDIKPIPKADNIELVFIDGWQCVAKKGEFRVLDKCVFFEIDSILPVHPIFAFMEKRKFKVKTAKFMKNISQGLALPISILKEFGIDKVSLEDDVTEAIGVTKYDPEANKIRIKAMRESYPWWKKLMLRYKYTRAIIKHFEQKSTFPSDIVSKTDEERIQNLSLSLDKYVNKQLEITEKYDGQSATYIYRPNFFFPEFIVCSRNQLLKNPDNSSWWTIARKDDILNKLKKLHRHMKLGRKDYVCIQGEILGMSIQKNKYKVNDYELYVFNLKTNTSRNNKQFNYQDTKVIFNEAQIALKQVPFLQTIKVSTVEELQAQIESIGCFKSTKNKNMYAEGIVTRLSSDTSQSFKYINPKFLLKFDE